MKRLSWYEKQTFVDKGNEFRTKHGVHGGAWMHDLWLWTTEHNLSDAGAARSTGELYYQYKKYLGKRQAQTTQYVRDQADHTEVTQFKKALEGPNALAKGIAWLVTESRCSARTEELLEKIGNRLDKLIGLWEGPEKKGEKDGKET